MENIGKYISSRFKIDEKDFFETPPSKLYGRVLYDCYMQRVKNTPAEVKEAMLSFCKEKNYEVLSTTDYMVEAKKENKNYVISFTLIRGELLITVQDLS